MSLILIDDKTIDTNNNYLRFAFTNPVTRSIIIPAILSYNKHSRIALPAEWQIQPKQIIKQKIITYSDRLLEYSKDIFPIQSKYIDIRSGRYICEISQDIVDEILDTLECDILTVGINPSLAANKEKVRTTASNDVVGFRRYYQDSVEITGIPDDWPHLMYIKSEKLSYILINGNLPVNFKKFILTAYERGLKLESVNVGGNVIDISSEDGLLYLISTYLSSDLAIDGQRGIGMQFKGTVIAGQNVRVAQKATILGPSIIESNANVLNGAVVINSILGQNVIVNDNEIIDSRVIINDLDKTNTKSASYNNNNFKIFEPIDQFKTWHYMSYARLVKRIIDFIGSLIVVILFAPLFPIIAFLIKIDSSGPIFYRAQRQGLHGKPIHCLKFRTMIPDADKMQEKLRIVNQVDGPQFKMEDDPRVSKIGKFLRDTCIDEIPQFINVLLGQMSIVGPRPSPESENSQCPVWRDARLSVKPGITGLWQISRTRRLNRDFQEWVYYDTTYVKELSFKLDIWICIKTIAKLINDFLDQF